MSRVLDELRFGPERTLNLRETLPSAQEAVRRCDGWLREQQIRGSSEVLIITGRGSHSVGGIPVIKQAVEKLLYSLRRRGVVQRHAEHNPGAFVVTMAPLRALTEAAPRRRDPRPPANDFDFPGLSSETILLLRDLSERSLESLGVTPDEQRVSDEMHRHLRVFGPALAGRDIDQALRAVLRRALAEYD